VAGEVPGYPRLGLGITYFGNRGCEDLVVLGKLGSEGVTCKRTTSINGNRL
jgi:hypothetical protein